MAGVLGLGSTGSQSLSQDMIDKLKQVDSDATVKPLNDKLDAFDDEQTAVDDIQSKITDLLNSVKAFSLNQSSGVNAFNQKSATSNGDSVVFDSDDLAALKTGSTTVNVTQLAQKDVYQSDIITDKNTPIEGNFTIQLGNGEVTKIDSKGKSYDDLVKEINKLDGMSASLDQVGDNEYRLVIKSTGTGDENKLTIGGGTNLGFSKPENHIQTAQNMQATVDGVNYSSSSNTITVDGLKISAVSTGTSSINVEDDSSGLADQMQTFVDAYNALNGAITADAYGDGNGGAAVLGDTSSVRDMLSQIKNTLFGSGSGNESMFSYGFSFDETNGNLTFNTNDFATATKGGTQGLEALFAGTPDKKGIATNIDELISVGGVNMSDYETNMQARKDDITKQRDDAQTALDAKYDQMQQQFAAYTTMISQMEQSFSSLQMMIQQSYASN